MSVFIGGSQDIKLTPLHVERKLEEFIQKQERVLIGDAHGVDKTVQAYFAQRAYPHVCVYASNGMVRNNLGQWATANIAVTEGVTGFEFYIQKDIAMAQDADCGLMIWDGKSRGTLNNIINLVKSDKPVLVYLAPDKPGHLIDSLPKAVSLIRKLGNIPYGVFEKLLQSQHPDITSEDLL